MRFERPPRTCCTQGSDNALVTQILVGLSGLEPPTSRLSGVRSNRLSYRPMQGKWVLFLFGYPFSGILPTSFPIFNIVNVHSGIVHYIELYIQKWAKYLD